jgi:DNA transformation protein
MVINFFKETTKGLSLPMILISFRIEQSHPKRILIPVFSYSHILHFMKSKETRQLSEFPNIGKVLLSQLKKAGIRTPAQLIRTGSKKAFLKIRKNDPGVCLDLLFGLEGAIAGVRWHELPSAKRKELMLFKKNLPS